MQSACVMLSDTWIHISYKMQKKNYHFMHTITDILLHASKWLKVYFQLGFNFFCVVPNLNALCKCIFRLILKLKCTSKYYLPLDVTVGWCFLLVSDKGKKRLRLQFFVDQTTYRPMKGLNCTNFQVGQSNHSYTKVFLWCWYVFIFYARFMIWLLCCMFIYLFI